MRFGHQVHICPHPAEYIYTMPQADGNPRTDPHGESPTQALARTKHKCKHRTIHYQDPDRYGVLLRFMRNTKMQETSFRNVVQKSQRTRKLSFGHREGVYRYFPLVVE